MRKDFDLSLELKVYLDNGVKSFTYKVQNIDYANKTVTVIDDDGNHNVFNFAMIDYLGGVYYDEPKANDPPATDDDKPIDLSEIPF